MALAIVISLSKKSHFVNGNCEKAEKIIITTSVVLGVIIAVGLFILLPVFVVDLFGDAVGQHFRSVIEGLVRICIFIVYIVLVSRMNDIKRVFMYHGAEHKSIHCYENGEELTVENVRKYSRLHPRCGTSFLLIVMVISMVVFYFISSDNIFIRLLLRLALLPVVAGISYEIIKFAGRYDNWFTSAISAPGKWFQYITTNEPDDQQIEVAIASLTAVMPERLGEDKW